MTTDQHSEILCSGCGIEERFLLHNVPDKGAPRRFCTTCVLKNHPGLFCPTCFDVFIELPPPQERVKCIKCSSISHSACVGFNVGSRYECPLCKNPNFAFFDIAGSNKKLKGIDGASGSSVPERRIDKGSAKVLLAAARIASALMNKAATVARVDAERKIKEAQLAKKRAREALERVAYLASQEEEEEKNKAETISPQKQIQNQVKHSELGAMASASVAGQGSEPKAVNLVSPQKRIQNQVDKSRVPPNNGQI